MRTIDFNEIATGNPMFQAQTFRFAKVAPQLPINQTGSSLFYNRLGAIGNGINNYAFSTPMMYGVYPALAALAARSLYNKYYASGGKTKKRSQRKRQTKKRL